MDILGTIKSPFTAAAKVSADVTSHLWREVTGRKDEKIKRDIGYASYYEEYYSGTDAVVLIGSTWVDDIVTLQYTVTNNKSPVYGYMSEKFDAVAKGTVVVQGQFAIAFKEVGYLSKILEDYKKTSYIKEREIGVLEEETGYYNGIGKHRVDRFGYVNRTYGNKVDVNGFDIIVVYGDFSGNRGGTIEVISNAHITSKSTVVEPTGEPIAEIYSFFARDLNDRKIGSISMEREEEINKSIEDIRNKPIDMEKAKEDIKQLKYTEKTYEDYKMEEESIENMKKIEEEQERNANLRTDVLSV